MNSSGFGGSLQCRWLLPFGLALACQRVQVPHPDTPPFVEAASEISTGLMGSRRVRRHPHRRT